MKKISSDKIMDFFAGKGFYIVLFLCVAAIGISGYMLLFSNNVPNEPEVGEYSLNNENDASNAVGDATVTVTTTPTAVKPTVAPEPTPAPVSVNPPRTVVARTVIVWPLKGEIIEVFSTTELIYSETMSDWRTHGGIDIAATLGTEVCAACSGTVESVNNDALMGTTVILDHGSGVKTIYANLQDTPTVKVLEKVSAGDVIGAVGDTAIAESAQASHLHFEVCKDGVAVNPEEYLPKK